MTVYKDVKFPERNGCTSHLKEKLGTMLVENVPSD